MPKPLDLTRFVLVCTSALFAGCGGQKHVPAGNVSRQSLEASLSAWRDGKPVGVQEASNPVIQAEDGDWRAKKKLTMFEIVSEEPVQSEAPRKFKVKLTLEGAAPIDAVFVVFGKDPIYVYRDRDYEKHFNSM